ncbi:hypothetical protein ACFV1B_14430 [Streptomyces sp. NPDC059637]|uniref:hypothetical protein n=1 Tax=Streptomyces sp. NPDC059637 TaxID=3347752 RepID=UPI0036B12B3E
MDQYLNWHAILLLNNFSTPKPATCESGILEWNQVESAGAMSAFCGIFAGFVFAGIIMVIGGNPQGGDGHSSRGLRLLLSCFFGLAASSYLYSIVTGELVCSRAFTAGVLSGGILAADAVVSVVALAWLLLANERNKHGEVRFFSGLIHLSAQFSALMLTVSSISFSGRMLNRQVPLWFNLLVLASGVTVMSAVFLCWRKPSPDAPSGTTPERWRNEGFPNRSVSACAWTTLVLSGILAVSAGVVSGIPHEFWLHVPPWVVYLTGEAPLLLSGAILTTAVRAVPKI